MQLFDASEHIQSYGFDNAKATSFFQLIECAFEYDYPISFTITPENVICGLVRLTNSTKFLIVGPAMSFECTQKHAIDILQRLHLPKSKSTILMNWLHTIPIIDLERFRQTLVFLDYLINNSDENEAIYVVYSDSSPIQLQQALVDSEPFYMENVSDMLEKQLLSYIESGNTNAMEAALNNFLYDSTIDVLPTSDTLRSYKNIFILSTGLASRAAIKGGVDYTLINSLSGTYITQIENYNSLTEVKTFIKQMFLDFTYRTYKSRLQHTDSLLIFKICKDIQAHLYEKSNPSSIATRLNMNYSYICRHFKLKMGKTITEYINETKIQESIRLLETTEMSLIQISSLLGFSSQNYFHTVFKKVTGLTPIEYKEKYNLQL